MLNKNRYAKLRRVRFLHKIDMQDFVKELNKALKKTRSIDADTIYRIERGAYQLKDLEIFRFYCDYYRVSPNWLLDVDYSYEFEIPRLLNVSHTNRTNGGKLRLICNTQFSGDRCSSMIGVYANVAAYRDGYIILCEEALRHLSGKDLMIGKNFTCDEVCEKVYWNDDQIFIEKEKIDDRRFIFLGTFVRDLSDAQGLIDYI